MNTLRLALFCVAGSFCAWPMRPAPVAAQPGPQPLTRGTVLLLRSERAMEGQIEKVGTQYRVQRGSGEVWVQPDQAACLFADWNHAYQFMRERTQLGDPDERFKLAQWCQLHLLTKEALEEARMVLEMRPRHAEARQLAQLLERKLAGPTTNPAAAPATPALAALPKVDLSSEAMIAFTTKVQPTLMNACAQCHSAATGGKFQLARITEGGQRGSTQYNLAAVVQFLDAEHPGQSPILIKSISAHGHSPQPPFKGRQSPPFLTLQSWIEETVATNPHLRRRPAVLSSEVSKQAAPLPVVSREVPAVPPSDILPAAAPLRPTDPYDPELFNRTPK